MPRENETLKTIKKGNAAIAVRRYADGRYGFDYKPLTGDRVKVRLQELEEAVKRAEETARVISAGRINLLSVTDDELAEVRAIRARREKSKSAEAIALEFIALKSDDQHLNSEYVANISRRLELFRRAFRQPLSEITAPEIEEWLRGLNKAPRNRNNIRDDVAAMFRFARERGYLPDQTTEAEKVKRLKIRGGEQITIWTPEELAKILATVRREFVPWVAIGAFAGIRTEEIQPTPRSRKDPLRWDDFDWRRKFVRVRAETAKTGHARIVPLLGCLVEWLEPWHGLTGPVMEGAAQIRNETRRIRELGGAYKKNALRHSFGSYRLAIVKSIAQVAEEMGNSPAIIRKEYHAPQVEAVAEAWFAISPVRPANVLPIGEAG